MRLATIEALDVPMDGELAALVQSLHNQGVTLLVPAGTSTSAERDVTPYWTLDGLASSPYVVTVGAASANKTWVRTESANGPTTKLDFKPDLMKT